MDARSSRGETMIPSFTKLGTKRVLPSQETAVVELVGMRQNLLTRDVTLVGLLSQPDSEPLSILRNLLSKPTEAADRIKARIRHRHQQSAPTQANQIVATQEAGELLREEGVNRDRTREALQEIRGGRTINSAEAETEPDVLERYTRDLTEMARRHELDSVIGREEEIGQVIQTLSLRKKNNPALIGEAGVGKTVINGFSRSMVSAPWSCRPTLASTTSGSPASMSRHESPARPGAAQSSSSWVPASTISGAGLRRFIATYPPARGGAYKPVPDWDLCGRPEPDFELDRRIIE